MNIVMNRRRFGTMLMASGAVIASPTLGRGMTEDTWVVARRLNMADRMRMLSERVAKAVVLIRLDVNREEDLKQLQEAHDEFDDILKGFVTGEGNSGIKRERVVGIVNKVKVVEELWVPMRAAVEEIVAAGMVDDKHFEFVESNDIALEVASHEVVKAIEEEYEGVDIELGLALELDIAGRMRMLTQRMTKDLAFAAIDHHAEESNEDLFSLFGSKGTVQCSEFDNGKSDWYRWESVYTNGV